MPWSRLFSIIRLLHRRTKFSELEQSSIARFISDARNFICIRSWLSLLIDQQASKFNRWCIHFVSSKKLLSLTQNPSNRYRLMQLLLNGWLRIRRSDFFCFFLSYSSSSPSFDVIYAQYFITTSLFWLFLLPFQDKVSVCYCSRILSYLLAFLLARCNIKQYEKKFRWRNCSLHCIAHFNE